MKSDQNSRRLSRREWLRTTAQGAALLGLAACGGAPVPATNQGAGTTSSPVGGQPVPAAGGNATTIQFITPGALGVERTMYQTFVDSFQKANPDISVKVSFEAWGDYYTKLPTILAGGAIPDVIHQHMSVVQDYAGKNTLTDLNSYMQRDNVKKEDYIGALFDAFSDGGKTFVLPKDSAAWGVYYNKDMFDAAGVPYPKDDWTLKDFQHISQELTRDENGNPSGSAKFDPTKIKQWGFNYMEPTPTASENARGFVLANGSDWYNTDYSQTLVTDPKVLEVLKMFADMRCQQHSVPAASQAQAQGDPFRSGLTAMTVGFHQVDFFCREEKVKFKYDVTYLPGGPGGQYVVVGASGWAIPAQSKHKEAAWKLVKYLTSKEVQTTIGQQHRWGVALKDAIDVITPTDPIAHFAMVHTDPLKGKTDRKVVAFKFPRQQSRIKQIYATEFDAVLTCAGGTVDAAAAKVKQQVDALLKT
ncbi:MAG: hypothetical protein NVS2B7_27510 [Herpetosiphon sp.]